MNKKPLGKILVVEDDAQVRELLSAAMTRRGYQATTAVDGQDALEKMALKDFEVVVADLVMPRLSGLDLLRAMKEQHLDTQLIIITGYADLPSAVEALHLGAYDFLQKPLELEVLDLTVERALEKYRLMSLNRGLVSELKSAKTQIEIQRRRELERLSQIGHALGSALKRDQIMQILQRALLSSFDRQAIIVGFVFWDEPPKVQARIYSHARLAPDAVADLQEILVKTVGAHRGPYLVAAEQMNVSFEAVGPDEICAPLTLLESVPLCIQDCAVGLIVMATPGGSQIGDDVRHVFHILAGQGVIAFEGAALFDQVRELARRDGLTKLFNQRYFLELLNLEVHRARRYRRAVSLIFVDIDFFKNVNDTHGHLTGNAVLETLAVIMQRTVRDTDIVARYGGEEFVILAAESSEKEAAAVAERLRRAVEAHLFEVDGHEIRLTISAGVASFSPGETREAEELLRRADEALYQAKHTGRNRVYSHYFRATLPTEQRRSTA